MQEYVTRLVVQRFGTQIFNDGLRQTLRLRYQEFEDQSSGETLSLLLRVRRDTERFINAFINVLFASLVGLAFLLWYAVTKSWLLVPVFLVGLLVLGGLSGLLSRQIRSQQRALNRETTRNAGFITESLRNVALIKSLGLTFREIRRLEAQTAGDLRPGDGQGAPHPLAGIPAGVHAQPAEAVGAVHAAVADLPRRAVHRRADRDAVHLGGHPGAAAGAGHHHPGLARSQFVDGELRRADGQADRPAAQGRGARRARSSRCASSTWCSATAARRRTRWTT